MAHGGGRDGGGAREATGGLGHATPPRFLQSLPQHTSTIHSGRLEREAGQPRFIAEEVHLESRKWIGLALLVLVALAAWFLVVAPPREEKDPLGSGLPRSNVTEEALEASPPPPSLVGTPPPPASPLSPAVPSPPLPDPSEEGIGALVVLVVDETERPVADAQVRITHASGIGPVPLAPAPTTTSPSTEVAPPPPPAPSPVERLVTDTQGLADFQSLRVGEWRVRVDHPEFAPGSTTARVQEEQETELRVRLRQKIGLTGRVLRRGNGEPVAGAHVRVVIGGSAGGQMVLDLVPFPLVLGKATADEEGRFRIKLPPDEVVTVLAQAEGYALAQTSLLLDGTQGEVVLHLDPGGQVSGRILAPDGSPCGDATVYVVPASDEVLLHNPRVGVSEDGRSWSMTTEEADPATPDTRMEGDRRAYRARADSEGYFQIGGLPLPAELRVLAEGCGGSRGGSGVLVLAEDHPRASADVLLEPRATLVVYVKDHAGKAVPTAQVSVKGVRGVPKLSIPIPILDGAPFLNPRGDDVLRNFVPPPPGSIASRFTGLGLGPHIVIVDGPAGRVETPVDLTEAGTHEMTVQVGTGRILHGLAVGEDGVPVPNAEVWWKSNYVKADGEGRFRIENLPSEPGTLRVRSRWHLPTDIEVRPGPKLVRVVLRARPVVAGRLRPISDGGPLPTRLGVAERDGDGIRYDGAAVEADGSFRYPLNEANVAVDVVLLPPGAADVRLGSLHLGPGEVHEVGEVQLDAGQSFTGRVVDEAGRAVSGAVVQAYHPDWIGLYDDDVFDQGHMAKTDREGAFVITGMHRGRVVVRVTHAGFAPTEVEGDTSADLRVPLAPPAYIEGVLLGSNGRPLGVVFVAFEGPRSAWLNRITAAVAQPDGKVRIGPLPAGRYSLIAYRRSEPEKLGDVEVAAGEVKKVVWRLP